MNNFINASYTQDQDSFVMPLPEKDYYSLQEMVVRWKTSLEDLHYYATHGKIEILVWLHVGVVNCYQLKMTGDGHPVPVIAGLKPYKDYAVIGADDLRQVFRYGTTYVRDFIDPQTREYLEIHESHAPYQIKKDDIVISRMERDRFEQFYALTCAFTELEEPYSCSPSFAGRPSSMHHVRQHFMERCSAGKLFPSLQQEANYLSHWAEQNITDNQAPKAKAIMNALRALYRDHRQSHSNQNTQEDIEMLCG